MPLIVSVATLSLGSCAASEFEAENVVLCEGALTRGIALVVVLFCEDNHRLNERLSEGLKLNVGPVASLLTLGEPLPVCVRG